MPDAVANVSEQNAGIISVVSTEPFYHPDIRPLYIHIANTGKCLGIGPPISCVKVVIWLGSF